MEIKQHKTCYGCKANTNGCALGYRVNKERDGERLRRVPSEPCLRPTTDREFVEAYEEYSAA